MTEEAEIGVRVTGE